MKLNKAKILQKCNNIRKDHNFLDSVRPREGMALCSEMLLFCALCELYEVDTIIESGLYYGVSTKMISDYFQGSGKRIISLDIDVLDETREIFAETPYVELIQADGNRSVPNLIKYFKTKTPENKVAVFIDGPKEKGQRYLAKQILQDVEFVAMHDLGEAFTSGLYENRLGEHSHLFLREFESFLLTTEHWFSQEFAELNDPQLNWLQGGTNNPWAQRDDGYDQQLWNPILQKITPEGFGMAVVSKYGVENEC